jgi:hypothetical protein
VGYAVLRLILLQDPKYSTYSIKGYNIVYASGSLALVGWRVVQTYGKYPETKLAVPVVG